METCAYLEQLQMDLDGMTEVLESEMAESARLKKELKAATATNDANGKTIANLRENLKISSNSVRFWMRATSLSEAAHDKCSEELKEIKEKLKATEEVMVQEGKRAEYWKDACMENSSELERIKSNLVQASKDFKEALDAII